MNAFLKNCRLLATKLTDYGLNLHKLSKIATSIFLLGLFSSAHALQQCNWHGKTYPVCATLQNGWGWENNASCVARADCVALPQPYGILASSSSSSIKSSAISSSVKSSLASSAIKPSSSSSVKSSVLSSSTAVLQQCNWYNTIYSVCASTQSGWGWENNKSCASRADCAALPAPYGLINASSSSSFSVSSASSVVKSSSPSSFSSSVKSSSSSATSNLAACSPTTFMGKPTLMIGAQMADVSANAAPFDARYMYLSGGIRPAGTCASSCSSACSGWWGCWQDTNLAPGQYMLDHIKKAKAATWQAQVPAVTYYEMLQSSGKGEGADEVTAINDSAFLGRYLDDWRFMLQKVGNDQALLHIEPDFWGYVRSVNSNPTLVTAKVTSANPTDCANQENNAKGFAKCMISMVRKYAPNAKVGLHASPWLIGTAGDGIATGNFMLALGAADGDFVITDPSDRDAGFYNSIGQNNWWTDASAANYLAWSKDVAATLGKPTVVWQIPLGNMSQNNTDNHWRDNKVDYLFAHLNEVSKAKIVALLFGAGESRQTNPETDSGNLINKTTNNWQSGGTPICQ